VPDVALEDGSVSNKAEDINDLAAAGKLPADPKSQAKPVNAEAQKRDEEEARVVSVKQLLHGAMQRALQPKTEKTVLTTGHWEIDRDTGGFRNECVWVVGAKSSWGKSSYLVMVADENIRRGKRVLIVSAEDPDSLYGDRLMVRRTRVDRHRFSAGALERDEQDRVTDALGKAEDVPVFLDARGKSVEWAAKRVRRLIQSDGIDLIAWDYLHAFDQEKPGQNGDRRAQLNYISRVMTDTVKTTGKAGIIFAQVTPDTKSQVPDMYEIRDSKDVVNAAEVVAIGFEPAISIERDQDGQKVIIADKSSKALVIAKNKPGPGPKGRVYGMGSDYKHGCFNVVKCPDDGPLY
jgi:replicative DNA helicase